ncbi:MAG: S8 family serine peptidase, partial [Armatimonadetes bacterium]|nr:S8 family serine peptidase [Akkermansiaceae bacterium]
MNSKKSTLRPVICLAVILIFAIGFILSGTYRNPKKPGKAESAQKAAEHLERKKISREDPESSPKRARSLMKLSLSDNGETLEIALDQAILRGVGGIDQLVQLNPPATPESLKKRLGELKAARGVFPLAYVEGAEKGFGSMRSITSDIRVKIPREKAAGFAREHGLEILALPEYAPDWVVFTASEPMEALAKIDGIRRDSEVESADVLIGRRPSTMALPNDTLIDDQWHLKASGGALEGTDMNVEDAWKYGETGGVRGTGIRIGIIDSGIQTSHPDFIGNIDTINDRDFIDDDNDPNPESDEDHGTAVGGVAAARGNNALGVSGVAPEAILVGERLITDSFITDMQIADALAHLPDLIEIKNNSWGYRGFLHKTGPLVKDAMKTSSTTGRGGKGTIFTFSAGNDGDDGGSGNYSELTNSIYSIGVGATDSLGKRAFYSSPGANLVISAPSHGFRGALGITTTDRTGVSGYNNANGVDGNYTDDFSGTSSSCPAVSGAIALMLEKNPNLGWRDVQAILIRSAVKFRPDDVGWSTNAAGLHFNNDFGAGLIDVTAAVNMAETWTNLEPSTPLVLNRENLGATIPDDSPVGRVIQFSLPTSNLIVEHVTMKLNISHSSIGELEIILTSPTGMVSRLAEEHGDDGSEYDDFTFNTVRSWGENSSGVWSLKILDRSSVDNDTGGTINSAEITIHGVVAAPVNPAPIVSITSPLSGTVISPNAGLAVAVSASDFDIDGELDAVTAVELFDNGVSVGTQTVAPYSFNLTPAIGVHSFVAKARDTEDKIGSSLPVVVTVKNQTPVINSVVINATDQAFDDTPLIISSVDVTDPESDAITIT